MRILALFRGSRQTDTKTSEIPKEVIQPPSFVELRRRSEEEAIDREIRGSDPEYKALEKQRALDMLKAHGEENTRPSPY